MQNKYLKYILIILTITVWGAIIYRIADGLGSSDTPPPPVTHTLPPALPATEDGFVLYADYPDPFIPEKDTTDSNAPKSLPTTSITQPQSTISFPPSPAAAPTLASVQSFLQYSGMITNPQKKLKIAIINLHGNEILVKEKEKHEDILIKKIEKEKIEIVYKKINFNIYKIN